MEHELIGKRFKVLSHGYIELIEFMGSDAGVEQAARISYGEGTRATSDTINLLRYLMRHYHTTPFEMAEMKFRIKMPMDVNRQWIRHRTANVNEYSTRYSLPINDTDETYEWRQQSVDNKQGSDGPIPDEWPDDPIWQPFKDDFGFPADYLSAKEKGIHKVCKEFYEECVELGVARELARKNLPLSTYTEIVWKCDLHNIMNFLRLRCDSHAQQEIREYANVMAGIVKQVFPISFEAWYDYVHMSSKFSRQEMQILQRALNRIPQEDLEQLVNESDISSKKRERREFLQKLSKNYDIGVDESFIIE